MNSRALTIWFNAFTKLGGKKTWLKHEHYPRVLVFFHCRDRPAKSIIISASNVFCFFLNLNPIYSKLKCNGKHILQLVTGLMLCVRSHVRCWRLGSQGPESLPSLTSRLVARGVAQWYSICLACAKPWVQFPALGGIKEFSKSFWKLFFLGSTGD